jgi:hypothetical protein
MKLARNPSTAGKSKLLDILKQIESLEIVDNKDGSFSINFKTTIKDERKQVRIKQ